MSDATEWVRAILEQNKDKSFVKRILTYNPDTSPYLDLGNGNRATHLMSWGEGDGKYYVFPTVLMTKEGKLKNYGKDAWNHVSKTGNYIEVDDAETADWLSKNYKLIWPENWR